MRRTPVARARAHVSRPLRSTPPGVHQHRWPPRANRPMFDRPTGVSDGGICPGRAEAIRRTSPVVPERQPAVLRDRIADRRLIIFMALSFTLMPSIVFYRSRRPIFAHALFALHLYAFLL